MRLAPAICVLLLSTALFAEQKPATSKDCKAGGPFCGISKQDLKRAEKDFGRGMKLQQESKSEEALAAFESANKLVPGYTKYITNLEIQRQALVTEYLNKATDAVNANHRDQAIALLKQAIDLDPQNQFAQQRMKDTLPPTAVRPLLTVDGPSSDLYSAAQPVFLTPLRALSDFHYRGFSKDLVQEVANAYGITVVFDDSVKAQPVNFELSGATFDQAMGAVGKMAKVFWVPISAKQIFVASDTADLRKQFERFAMRTFYLPNATAPQSLNDLVNMLRTVLDVRFITISPASTSITVRASYPVLQAATKLVEMFQGDRPQVLLELQVFQIDHSVTEQLGLDIPQQFQMINLPGAALAALSQTNVSDLLNQLFSSGAINQANNTAIQALLAQVQNSQLSSLLQTPFGTFGGGATRYAVPLPAASVHFQLNESSIKSLQKLSLRAAQGDPATIRIGTRFPVLNATFSPIFNTASIASVIQNNSYAAPFPSFNYEDLGITFKATPQVLTGGTVALKVELQIRALSAQQLNGIPVISTREYSGSVALKDGEAGFVVGSLSQSEQQNLSGIPGLSRVPGLKQATTYYSPAKVTDELLVVVVPHIVSGRETFERNQEIWMPSGQ